MLVSIIDNCRQPSVDVMSTRRSLVAGASFAGIYQRLDVLARETTIDSDALMSVLASATSRTAQDVFNAGYSKYLVCGQGFGEINM